MRRHPCILGDPQTKRDKARIGSLPSPSQGHRRERKCYVTPAFSGGPKTKGDKIRIGYLTPAFSGAQKRTEMLRHPCFLGDPGTKVDKIRIGYLTPAFSGAQKRAEMLRHPCILGVKGDKSTSGYLTLAWGPKEGGNATSPLYSLGPQTKGDKIGIGCLTPAFSGGPKEGGNATSPLHSRGSLNKGGQNHKWPHWGHEQKCGYAAQKNILHRKTPLKPPQRPFVKGGGGFQNPSWYRNSEKPTRLGLPLPPLEPFHHPKLDPNLCCELLPPCQPC